MDIPDSFEDDLKNDCENVAVPVVVAFPFIAIEQRSSVGAGSETTLVSYFLRLFLVHPYFFLLSLSLSLTHDPNLYFRV